MSGAEAAGLAVGVVALASLFTTCIELLDYVELGRNYLQDYKLACNKINILHTRLSIWGGTARILLPGDEHPLLRIPAKRDAVSEGLQSLKDVLQNTELLRRKYDLSIHYPSQSNAKDQVRSQKLSSWSHVLRKRTTWSIRDKAKFDRFIEDVSFLMSNLEKVTEKLDSTNSQKDMPDQPSSTSNTGKPRTKPGGNTSQQETKASATDEQSSHSTSEPPLGATTPSLDFSNCSQKNTGASSGLMGTVGLLTGPIRFIESRQENDDTSDGVMGAMSEAAHAHRRTGGD